MKQPQYNAETELAMQEARDIIFDKIPTKKYASAHELFAELDEEMDIELNAELDRKKTDLFHNDTD